MKRLFLKAAGAAATGALLQACGGGGGSGGGGGTPSGNQTLLQLLQQDGRFSSLLSAVQRAGLTDQFAQAGASQTLFAPTNEAFAALNSRVGSLSDAQLTSILRFHVTPQFLSAAAINSLGASSGTAATLYDFRGDAAVLIFVRENSQLNIWDGIGRTSITLGETDIAASNGVLHVVNDVLLPRGVLTVSGILSASIDSFSNYRAAMSPADVTLLDGAGPFTVFVPSNDSPGTINVRRHVLSVQIGSDAFPTTTTQYTTRSGATSRLTKGTTPPQVVNQKTVLGTLTDSTATAAIVTDVDFYGTNGVVHVIDKVLV